MQVRLLDIASGCATFRTLPRAHEGVATDSQEKLAMERRPAYLLAEAGGGFCRFGERYAATGFASPRRYAVSNNSDGPHNS